MPCFGRIIMRIHDLVVFFAMQVARSLRIRSRYLAMPAGKARRTQAQLHAATRGSVRFHADMSLQPERRMYAYPHFSDAQSPKQMTAVSTACRPHRQSPNAEERRACWEAHTMVRCHCEAAHSRAHAIASARLGRSFGKRVRAPSTNFKPATTALAVRPPRSPPGHREVPEGGCTGGLHSAAEACGVPPHTVQ